MRIVAGYIRSPEGEAALSSAAAPKDVLLHADCAVLAVKRPYSG